LIFLLALLFPLFWALALWVAPAGPVVFGASILPFLGMALLAALVIAVLKAAQPPPAQEREEASVAVTVFDVAFWLPLMASVAMIVAAYVT